MYKNGASYYKEFTTASPSTGAATNADSLPVANANHNGVDDSSFNLTVTNLSTGRYKITGTVPSGYSKGDVLNVSVAATCSSIAGVAIVDTFLIDTKYLGDLNDVAATAIVSGGSITTSGGGVPVSSGSASSLASLTTSAIIGAIPYATIGSVSNLTGISLDGGVVLASPSPTSSSFSASGLPSGLVTGDLVGQTVIFQTGQRTGVRRTISVHTVTSGTSAITLAAAMGAAPATGDTFLVC